MPIRATAFALAACSLLAACATAPAGRTAGPIGLYKVVVTDRAGPRVLSSAEQADPQMRADVEACENAKGLRCREIPDVGEARNIFQRGADEVVVVAALAMLWPGTHFHACRLNGPSGETIVTQGPMMVAGNDTGASLNLSVCSFPLHEEGVWARGVWQVEVVMDGVVLARPTFTIRERGEVEA